MDRKLHVDTLILIPMEKFYMFSYSRRTDKWNDADINPVWASLTTFLQVKKI
jgi:hypothetical protein